MYNIVTILHNLAEITQDSRISTILYKSAGEIEDMLLEGAPSVIQEEIELARVNKVLAIRMYKSRTRCESILLAKRKIEDAIPVYRQVMNPSEGERMKEQYGIRD
jgi:rubrerythrin